VRCWLALAYLCGTASAGSAPELAFARGNVLLAQGDDAGAVIAFDEVVDHFPTSARAGEAAIHSLDVLNRQRRFDEMQQRVERWIRKRRLLLQHRELARTLRRLYFQFRERTDAPPPSTDWEREALDRLADFAANPTVSYGDELLYEAGWQFYVSDHPDAAGRAWRVLIALYPKSTLVPRARIGLADL